MDLTHEEMCALILDIVEKHIDNESCLTSRQRQLIIILTESLSEGPEDGRE